MSPELADNTSDLEPAYEQVQLTDADTRWLEKLRGSPIDEAWIENTNITVATGSIDMRGVHDPEEKQLILAAREQFYAVQLGWADEEHPLHDAYMYFGKQGKDSILPLPKTTIGVQRVLDGAGINIVKVVRTMPTILRLSPQSVQAKIDQLDELEIDPQVVINRTPTILNIALSEIVKRVEHMDAWGIKTKKVVQAMPSILTMSRDYLDSQIIGLQGLGGDEGPGLDVFAAIHKAPSLIVLDLATMKEKMDNFKRLGINPVAVFNSQPSIYSLSIDTVNEKFAALEERGFDVGRLFKKHPGVLSLKLDTVDEKIANLDQLGLDGIALFSKTPDILKLATGSIERRMRLIHRTALTLGWAGSVSELVTKFPTILAYGDEKLMVHARLLARHGRSDISENEVMAHVMNALESHIIALEETGTDSSAAVSVVRKRSSVPERKQHVERLLVSDRERIVGLIGVQTVRAYEKYAAHTAKRQ